ncbi:multiple resistance and pH regulation protein F [Caldalkalibacillus thermarum TA2.A1]|uniref:Multiple resistance and pH regulation protein F n=1 Tax=Caldalkalibacillus thermarum (strain TA2.A1) TaxID=986075 RepID=F5L8P1_CALTT|nr:Na(+)/H(+) antiporter subunit F1 [Caldalkalibacillus thermarum]EGL82280.1 multiple resistance and pH regulation protein F [Caldalkalibacillus thermarum TA2.A1]QZT33427.1 Na(+)/H(+) antiporter subunit F1 [Caldalkalibacillus thermarum TA2.A1]GGK18147.1 Na(+)/H(+) antiporter subunit F [Caldalkalibacillus thermarum]
MLSAVLWLVLIMMSVSILICFLRVLKGPTTADRVVALDTIGINLIGFVGLLIMVQNTLAYVEVALVIGILAFIGTIALAKFIERGTVLDLDRDRH